MKFFGVVWKSKKEFNIVAGAFALFSFSFFIIFMSFIYLMRLSFFFSRTFTEESDTLRAAPISGPLEGRCKRFYVFYIITYFSFFSVSILSASACLANCFGCFLRVVKRERQIFLFSARMEVKEHHCITNRGCFSLLA